MTSRWFLLVVLGLAAGASAARIDPTCRAATAGAPLVVTADLWCPYTCEVDNTRPGYLVELMQKIYTPRGFTVRYELTPWTRALARTRRGQADVALGTVGDEARGLVVPAEPGGRNPNGLAVRRDDPWRWQGVESLADRQLGVVAGYAYTPEIDRWIAANADNPRRIQALSGSEAALQNLKKLESGRLDVVVDNLYVLREAIGPGLYSRPRIAATLEGPPVYAAFSPAHPHAAACARVYSDGVEALRRSGELAELLRRYGVDDWAEADS